MTALFDPDAIAAHDAAFALAHPDWDEVHGSRRLVDPLVCLARRESPKHGAPACGAWLSEHCALCGLCPGLHADDCDCPERTDVAASPTARTPRRIQPGDTAPIYGPPTRLEAAIETAIRSGVDTTEAGQ